VRGSREEEVVSAGTCEKPGFYSQQRFYFCRKRKKRDQGGGAEITKSGVRNIKRKRDGQNDP